MAKLERKVLNCAQFQKLMIGSG